MRDESLSAVARENIIFYLLLLILEFQIFLVLVTDNILYARLSTLAKLEKTLHNVIYIIIL